MQTQKLQARVQHIINAVLDGRPVEDTRVELKSEWIDKYEAARRIAGHANAARGEPIVWILGIDEKARQITGVDAHEMDSWIKGVEKHFDDDAPRLVADLNIHRENKTIVVLYFETHHGTRFVIKNPNGGSPQFEVPWRSATGIRSAKRVDLLQILLPISRIPHVRVTSAELNLAVQQNSLAAYPHSNKRLFSWTLNADLYITPQIPGRIVIPHQNCLTTFGVAGHGDYILTTAFKPIGKSSTIICSATEIIVIGPGSVRLEGTATTEGTPAPHPLPTGKAGIRIEMEPANTDKRIVNEIPLKHIERHGLASFLWNGSQWTT